MFLKYKYFKLQYLFTHTVRVKQKQKAPLSGKASPHEAGPLYGIPFSVHSSLGAQFTIWLQIHVRKATNEFSLFHRTFLVYDTDVFRLPKEVFWLN